MFFTVSLKLKRTNSKKNVQPVVSKACGRLCIPPDDLGEGPVSWRSLAVQLKPLLDVGAWYNRKRRSYTKIRVCQLPNGVEKSIANLAPAVEVPHAQILEPSSGGNDLQVDEAAWPVCP